LLSPGRSQGAGGRTGGGAGNTLLEVWNRSETRHIAVTSAFRGFARATAGKGLVVTYGTDPVEKRESSVYDGMEGGLGRAMQMRECLSWHEDMDDPAYWATSCYGPRLVRALGAPLLPSA